MKSCSENEEVEITNLRGSLQLTLCPGQDTPPPRRPPPRWQFVTQSSAAPARAYLQETPYYTPSSDLLPEVVPGAQLSDDGVPPGHPHLAPRQDVERVPNLQQ